MRYACRTHNQLAEVDPDVNDTILLYQQAANVFREALLPQDNLTACERILLVSRRVVS
jgi:hypothetical protein